MSRRRVDAVVAALRSEEPGDHWVLASAPSAAGYQLTCACGWRSAGTPDPRHLFDEWAQHIVESARMARPAPGDTSSRSCDLPTQPSAASQPWPSGEPPA